MADALEGMAWLTVAARQAERAARLRGTADAALQPEEEEAVALALENPHAVGHGQ
jgi:hypothetical protein